MKSYISGIFFHFILLVRNNVHCTNYDQKSWKICRFPNEDLHIKYILQTFILIILILLNIENGDIRSSENL